MQLKSGDASPRVAQGLHCRNSMTKKAPNDTGGNRGSTLKSKSIQVMLVFCKLNDSTTVTLHSAENKHKITSSLIFREALG